MSKKPQVSPKEKPPVIIRNPGEDDYSFADRKRRILREAKGFPQDGIFVTPEKKMDESRLSTVKRVVEEMGH